MKPVVNLYKLGRLPYVKALNVQQALFNNLKYNITSIKQNDANHSESEAYNNDAIIGYSKKKHFFTNNLTDIITTKFSTTKNNNVNTRNTTTTFPTTTTNTFNLNQFDRNSLLLVEHEPVYTIGIRSKDYNEDYVLKLKNQLKEHNLKADFVKTNRGGLITFHGPGQLVAYPIIYLGDFKNTIQNKSVRAYVNLLEAVIIDTLSKVGLNGAHTVKEYPGVWLDGGKRKIAFIGISCNRFVTMHGISINCDCDLSWFNHIVSCGIENKEITSIIQEYSNSLENNSIDNKTGQSQNFNSSLLSKTLPKDLSSSSSSSKILATTQRDNHKFLNNNFCVEHISDLFCESFSKKFDCIIEGKDLNSLFPIIGKL